ncbi:DUF5627 domain-containing protein [uncultured Polaribacter sp.]|uniref:DUF5627 domain-containing protein n=1 Tax=uncultured Polaribacter sp. TaxID=174711 RepID=UPI0026029EE4|nr:DUF5627 domain-containing protein [uncultured Polaribacter sp.]
MKNKLVIIFAFALAFIACENQENSFDDFGSTAVYFPFQTPIRTLIQGRYDLGFNDNDNNGRFEIGLTMTGVYENTEDRTVGFELAPDLIDAAALGLDTVNVKILPASYYTIEQESPLTIPAGSIKGRIPVQLTDDFFNDPLAYAGENEVHYVVPLKITNYEGIDSLLTGVPAEGVLNPIKIKADDWETLPKDYTLYGIKFTNKYSGIYLRRGEDIFQGTKDSLNISSGIRIDNPNYSDTVIYSKEYVEQDELTSVITSGKNQVTNTNLIKRGTISSDKELAITLEVSDNGDVIVSPVENGNQTVTGSGKWVEDGDQWGGKTQNVLYLEYQFTDIDTIQYKTFGRVTDEVYINFQHQVKDTLVVRDRNIKFEEFIINLEKN